MTSFTVSKEELRGWFHLPLHEVAQELGVCPTVFKKLCRQAGIQRWPYRRLRSLTKSIETKKRELEQVAPGCADWMELHIALQQLQALRARIELDPNILVSLTGKMPCELKKPSTTRNHAQRQGRTKDGRFKPYAKNTGNSGSSNTNNNAGTSNGSSAASSGSSSPTRVAAPHATPAAPIAPGMLLPDPAMLALLQYQQRLQAAMQSMAAAAAAHAATATPAVPGTTGATPGVHVAAMHPPTTNAAAAAAAAAAMYAGMAPAPMLAAPAPATAAPTAMLPAPMIPASLGMTPVASMPVTAPKLLSPKTLAKMLPTTMPPVSLAAAGMLPPQTMTLQPPLFNAMLPTGAPRPQPGALRSIL